MLYPIDFNDRYIYSLKIHIIWLKKITIVKLRFPLMLDESNHTNINFYIQKLMIFIFISYLDSVYTYPTTN